VEGKPENNTTGMIDIKRDIGKTNRLMSCVPKSSVLKTTGAWIPHIVKFTKSMGPAFLYREKKKMLGDSRIDEAVETERWTTGYVTRETSGGKEDLLAGKKKTDE